MVDRYYLQPLQHKKVQSLAHTPIATPPTRPAAKAHTTRIVMHEGTACRLRIYDYPELHEPLDMLLEFQSLHAPKDCPWHTSEHCQSSLFTGIGSKNK